MPAASRQLTAVSVASTPSGTMAKNEPLLNASLHAATPPSAVSLWSTFFNTTCRPWMPPDSFTSSCQVTSPSYARVTIAASGPLNPAMTLTVTESVATPGADAVLVDGDGASGSAAPGAAPAATAAGAPAVAAA